MANKGSPAIGKAFASYDLMDKVAEGGMCQVYRGRCQKTRQIVAIKILPVKTAKNEVLLRRFVQEFRVASRLDHPGIVRALDFDDTHPTPFLVMEYVDGESLGVKVDYDGPFPEQEAIRLMCQVCQALQYAHEQGVIHRDIKPDNLLLTPSGDVKITDFGLVKEMFYDEDLTRTGRGLGTPHYMAPEQFRNAKTAGIPADVYSLGATLYTLVTGKLPFEGSSPMEAWLKKMELQLKSPRLLVPSLSERTETAILRAMDADPTRRPSCCLALRDELLGGSRGSVPVPVSPPEKRVEDQPASLLPKRPMAWPTTTGWIVALLLLLLSLVLGFLLFR